MKQERLKEIAYEATDALNSPQTFRHSSDQLLSIVAVVPELVDYISTLESELQQVKVERGGLREALENVIREKDEDGMYGDVHPRIIAMAEAALATAPAARTEHWCGVCDRPKADCECVENGGTY